MEKKLSKKERKAQAQAQAAAAATDVAAASSQAQALANPKTEMPITAEEALVAANIAAGDEATMALAPIAAEAEKVEKDEKPAKKGSLREALKNLRKQQKEERDKFVADQKKIREDAKAAAKVNKVEKSEAKKVYTRVDALCDAIKANNGQFAADLKVLITDSQILLSKANGVEGKKLPIVAKYIVSALVNLGLATVDNNIVHVNLPSEPAAATDDQAAQATE